MAQFANVNLNACDALATVIIVHIQQPASLRSKKRFKYMSV